MPLLLIKGTFRPGTGVPDGDTVRFAADNSNLLFRLMQQGSPPRLNEDRRLVRICGRSRCNPRPACRRPMAAHIVLPWGASRLR